MQVHHGVNKVKGTVKEIVIFWVTSAMEVECEKSWEEAEDVEE